MNDQETEPPRTAASTYGAVSHAPIGIRPEVRSWGGARWLWITRRRDLDERAGGGVARAEGGELHSRFLPALAQPTACLPPAGVVNPAWCGGFLRAPSAMFPSRATRMLHSFGEECRIDRPPP